MQDMLNSRDIVTSMCADIETMTHAASAYMESVKLNINGVSGPMADNLLKLIDRIELAVNILDTEEMISQYPEKDRNEFKNYLADLRKLIDKNKKAINATKDVAWMAANI